MNHMKDCNAMQYGYYLDPITFERDFKGDWVDYSSNIVVGI